MGFLFREKSMGGRTSYFMVTKKFCRITIRWERKWKLGKGFFLFGCKKY